MYVHDIALQFGGVKGVINKNSLSSAITRPYTGYFDSIHEKAAALVESVILNHGFADANKRTAVLAFGVLIKRSGYHCTVSNEELVDFVVGVASGKFKYVDILAWFEPRLLRD